MGPALLAVLIVLVAAIVIVTGFVLDSVEESASRQFDRLEGDTDTSPVDRADPERPGSSHPCATLEA